MSFQAPLQLRCIPGHGRPARYLTKFKNPSEVDWSWSFSVLPPRDSTQSGRVVGRSYPIRLWKVSPLSAGKRANISKLSGSSFLLRDGCGDVVVTERQLYLHSVAHLLDDMCERVWFGAGPKPTTPIEETLLQRNTCSEATTTLRITIFR